MESETAAARILGLFPYFDRRSVGGVQASARVAWEALERSGEPGRDRWLFLYGNGPGSRVGNSDNCVVASSRAGAFVAAARTRWKPDILLIWHLHLLKLRPCFPLARTAVFLHGIEAWRGQGMLQRSLLGQVDLFLCNSEHTWREFVRFNPQFAAGPRTNVPLGLGEAAQSGLPNSQDCAALMVSRMARSENYKGHREMIRAWPLVQRRRPQAELWIVGDGDLRPDLEALAGSVGCSDTVRFHGQVSEERKEELIRRSRCLALPSRAEGFGLVYLEAMRLGRPCLVSDCDAGREVVNPPEAGLAANPSDPEALTEATVRLLTPGTQWDDWSAAARKRYESRYTAAHFQRRLLAALTEL